MWASVPLGDCCPLGCCSPRWRKRNRLAIWVPTEMPLVSCCPTPIGSVFRRCRANPHLPLSPHLHQSPRPNPHLPRPKPVSQRPAHRALTTGLRLALRQPLPQPLATTTGCSFHACHRLRPSQHLLHLLHRHPARQQNLPLNLQPLPQRPRKPLHPQAPHPQPILHRPRLRQPSQTLHLKAKLQPSQQTTATNSNSNNFASKETRSTATTRSAHCCSTKFPRSKHCPTYNARLKPWPRSTKKTACWHGSTCCPKI